MRRVPLFDLDDTLVAKPYRRGMLREGRGTCSTKHLFLAEALAEHFPETEPLSVHRVYTLAAALGLSDHPARPAPPQKPSPRAT